jgi:hypothetical protein
VRYVTQQFAHPETLDRARRWLVQAGFDPSRLVVHTHATPRLAVAVGPGEGAEVELLIDAALASDPDGCPSFLDLAPQGQIDLRPEQPGDSVIQQPHSNSFVIGWRPIDNDREVYQTTTELHLHEAYAERGD